MLSGNVPQIKGCTQIAEKDTNRPNSLHLLRVAHDRRLLVPGPKLVRDEPAGRAHEPHGDEAERIVSPRVAVGRLVFARHHLAQRLERRLGVVGVSAVGPGQAAAQRRAPAAVEQRFVLAGVGLDRVLALAAGGAGGAAPARVDRVVVEALADEDEVGEAEVGGQHDGGRRERGEEGACCGRAVSVGSGNSMAAAARPRSGFGRA